MAKDGIDSAHSRLTDSVIALPGVSGTAIGECSGKPCLKVYVSKRNRELMGRIPNRFRGFRVVVEESGVFRPLDR